MAYQVVRSYGFAPARRAEVICQECGCTFTVDRDEDGFSIAQYRCQGATPDLCRTAMCDECVVKCAVCDLPVCEKHRREVEDIKGVVCDNCLSEADSESDLVEGGIRA